VTAIPRDEYPPVLRRKLQYPFVLETCQVRLSREGAHVMTAVSEQAAEPFRRQVRVEQQPQ
jgi:hypothetical protein